MEEITVNGKTYYSRPTAQEIVGDLKIVILQRGWVLIGRLSQSGDICKLKNAKVIRRWGTTRGLGELAKEGKKKDTILDETYGEVEFHQLTMVFSICADEGAWTNI